MLVPWSVDERQVYVENDVADHFSTLWIDGNDKRLSDTLPVSQRSHYIV